VVTNALSGGTAGFHGALGGGSRGVANGEGEGGDDGELPPGVTLDG